jgi:hypothetical protein
MFMKKEENRKRNKKWTLLPTLPCNIIDDSQGGYLRTDSYT